MMYMSMLLLLLFVLLLLLLLCTSSRIKCLFIKGTPRHIHQQAVNRRVHSVDTTRRAEMRRHHNKVLLLSDGCRSEAQIRTETNDPDSVHATSTRQNIIQSLVHITDTAYNFTQHLTEHVLTLQNSDTLVTKGERTHQFVFDNLLTNEFQHMFNGEHDIESPQPSVDKLFNQIVSLFSRVMLKQLRKDFMAEVMRQKKQAHRKALMTGEGRAGSHVLQFSALMYDNSTKHKHELLQTCAKTKQGRIHFTKLQLLTMCMRFLALHGRIKTHWSITFAVKCSPDCQSCCRVQFPVDHLSKDLEGMKSTSAGNVDKVTLTNHPIGYSVGDVADGYTESAPRFGRKVNGSRIRRHTRHSSVITVDYIPSSFRKRLSSRSTVGHCSRATLRCIATGIAFSGDCRL